jgi:hypothetical protein
MGEVSIRMGEMITEYNVLGGKSQEGNNLLKKQTCEGEEY